MQIDAGTDPFTLFQSWYDEAVASEINDPDAMALASVDADGMPSVRMVLLKEWSDEGFVFYTNYESRKSGELLGTGKAAFCMHWKSLRRQVRVVGPVGQVPGERSDAYFATRGRGSRIGAWASAQSRPLASRETLAAAGGGNRDPLPRRCAAPAALGRIPYRAAGDRILGRWRASPS